MNEYVEKFDKNGYVHLKEFLNLQSCRELTVELFKLVELKKTTKDSQCPLSEAIHGAACFDKLLEDLLPHFETACGRKLYPTYSYARLYKPGEELANHRDRESCEISATLTLGFSGKSWPIYMGDHEDKSGGNEIIMNVGDAVLYKGQEKWHWREIYQGNDETWLAQVFLHYVDANGPNAEWKYDKREKLSHHDLNDNREVLFWVYDDILTEKACDIIISTYDKDYLKKEPPFIGDGQINRDIRNVERFLLPIHKDIGGRLVAAGINANHQVWKFDITHSNQSEFLKYPANGKYSAHLDTIFNAYDKETRKLTVLAFLNDDFEGGKFFIQNSENKVYPPQRKGTVLVFPSFLLHGVEDVTKGTRYSVVAWLVGPSFK